MGSIEAEIEDLNPALDANVISIQANRYGGREIGTN